MRLYIRSAYERHTHGCKAFLLWSGDYEVTNYKIDPDVGLRWVFQRNIRLKYYYEDFHPRGTSAGSQELKLLLWRKL